MSRDHNKHVDSFVDQQTMTYCEAGHWPEVEFVRRPTGGFQLSIMEYVNVKYKFDRCYHEELKKMGVDDGIYTKKRIVSILPMLNKLAKVIEPAGSLVLAIDQKVMLIPIRSISNMPRIARITTAVYNTASLDIQMVRENGYEEDECGSAKIWEILIVEVNNVWRPFSMTNDEREFQKVGGR